MGPERPLRLHNGSGRVCRHGNVSRLSARRQYLVVVHALVSDKFAVFNRIFNRRYFGRNKNISYLNESIRTRTYDSQQKIPSTFSYCKSKCFFNLEKVINTTLNDQVTFKNLGHFVMSDLLRNHYHTKNFDLLMLMIG